MTEDGMVGWHHRLHERELSKHWEMVKGRETWCAAVHGATKSQIQLSNLIATTITWATVSVSFSF